MKEEITLFDWAMQLLPMSILLLIGGLIHIFKRARKNPGQFFNATVDVFDSVREYISMFLFIIFLILLVITDFISLVNFFFG